MVSARSMAAGAVTVSPEWGIVCVSETAASIASTGGTASFRAGMRVADSVSFGLLAGSFGGSFPAISFTSAMSCSDHGLQSWGMTSSNVDQTTSAVIRLADGLAWPPCGAPLGLGFADGDSICQTAWGSITCTQGRCSDRIRCVDLQCGP